MKKILIVDDQVEIRDLVEITLRVSDYNILKASSGEDAIEIAEKEKPDLIIMDIMMPGKIDGMEAARILKNNDKTRESIIIFLSAKDQEVDIEAGKAVGASGYFVKPFSPLDLINKVEESLDS